MRRLFGVFIPVSVLLLLLSEALLIFACFVLAAYIALPADPSVFLFYDDGLTHILLVVACVVLFLHLTDLYSDIRVSSHLALIQHLCMVMGGVFLSQALISYVKPGLRFPSRIMILGSALAIVVIYCWRLIYSRHVLGVIGGQRLLVVGGNYLVQQMSDYIDLHPELGMDIVGYVGDYHPDSPPVHNGKALGSIRSLREVADAVKPDRIILAFSDRRQQTPMEDLLELRYCGYLIEEVSTTYEAVCGRVCTKELRPSQFIFCDQLGPGSGNLFLQKVFNFSIALVGILLTWPFMLLSAIAVRLTSPGPILYRQERVGLDGNSFMLYKFRSMAVDAEVRTGAVWATKNDPRVTPVGKILRKHRLDELPQLFNVLRGDMSIVGPRPERPKFVNDFCEKLPYYQQRHSVRPGITGWAQINYKYGETFEDTIAKLEYDLYYIKNMSPTLDAYIIFHTVKAMLLTRGAQ